MKSVVSSILRAGNPELQDRIEIFRFEDRVLIAAADGAGGISGGTQAAELFMQLVRGPAASLTSADACRQLLNRIDRELALSPECGETTGVLVGVAASGNVFGAGVGDSLVWAFASHNRMELTGQQERKPLLGSGVSAARPFAQGASDTTVVVATDGLWKYASLEAIEKCVRTADASGLADQLCELVRLRSGDFPDDVAIATCRVIR